MTSSSQPNVPLTAVLDDVDKTVRAAVDGRRYVVHLSAESSDFVRFNHGRVRQAGSIRQLDATLTIADGNRHTASTISLSRDHDVDTQRIRRATTSMLDDLVHVDEDPFFCFPDADAAQTNDDAEAIDVDAREPDDAIAITHSVVTATQGLDFVGILANGSIERAVTTSAGKTRAFSRPITHLDWSIYAGEGAAPDKALKQSLAGPKFDETLFGEKLEEARERLPILRRTPRQIERGSYRAYLAPAAVEELFSLLAYGTFSQRAAQTKTSALIRLQLGEVSFDSRVTVVDDVAGGSSPRFSHGGFDRPGVVPLIENGAYAGALTSPRSAREYSLTHTGADSNELPSSLRMQSGTLASKDILEKLGTGVYVGNLWYCNFSDPRACRITGMTRFGTFWVEDGVVVAPLSAMRFDSSLYRMLGDSLEDLDDVVQLALDADTYGHRSTSSKRVPGVLVSKFDLTL